MLEKLKNSLLFVLLVAIPFLIYTNYKGSRKLGYITTAKVFDEFSLKKELESDLKKNQIAKQSYLDSLKLKIQTLSLNNNDQGSIQIEEYKKIYLLKEKQFNDENEQIFQQYNDKIWKQLNQYVEDYGKEFGYDYVFGSAGQGNIMFANSGDNLTEDVIKFVNAKYSGKR